MVRVVTNDANDEGLVSGMLFGQMPNREESSTLDWILLSANLKFVVLSRG